MPSRRKFITESAVVAAALATSGGDSLAHETPKSIHTTSGRVSLCGPWKFRVDTENVGTKDLWAATDCSTASWDNVEVPHTWQIDPPYSAYRGIAWYRRTFDVLQDWQDSAVRVEFEAVFHSATVWVNGQLVGEHARKGYTAFSFDIAAMLRWGQPNTIAVRVDNAFNEHMLPRGPSSDWANDGGIFRPVQLLVSPKTFVERVDVEAVPNLGNGEAAVSVSAHCRNTGAKMWRGTATYRIVDDETGLIVGAGPADTNFTIQAGARETLTLRATLANAKLWHFDSPHLYRLEFQINDGHEEHQYATHFGVKKFEIRDGAFHLNGEAVRLMGVERMAGSNPGFGMAEPAEWIAHDHRDLKHLNCVFTRVHWPQDRRVLDFCDRHGILMQLEVPTWGSATFHNMGAQPDSDIMENGLEQLREMMERDGNHPSVVCGDSATRSTDRIPLHTSLPNECWRRQNAWIRAAFVPMRRTRCGKLPGVTWPD